ncbi:hypothetical protein BR93DRAFT_947440 [Coniochaeta sp. PMI_546]|nr:hypothetical protein BR93DRAFT_947440 [Coniochaeta sp. PMI_546]
MRLLERDAAGEIRLTKDFVGREIPRYAILSHTWADGEVLFKDMVDGTVETKPGYEKIRFCADQAWADGLRFCWVDTCCIDKTNAVELQEAINSMFRWYRGAAKCYAYLADVPAANWRASFRNSRWFTRGWTLQELIAPMSVGFFSKEGHLLGSREALEQDITAVTGIPLDALRGCALSDFSVRERFAWMDRRETTRDEDRAYALLGIFDVHMPLIYGEGANNAFRRLREVISPSTRAAEDKAKDDGCIAELRDTDPRVDKKRIEQTKGGLLEGSCQWVLDHADFQRWYRDEQSRLLWIKGDAGKGKTMLLCGIVDALTKSVHDGSMVSFFFLQATDPRINHALAVVRGLIYLLVEQQPSLVRHLREQFDHAGKKLFQDANAWTATCTILTHMLQDPAVHMAYLVVNALDECQDDGLFKVLNLIASLSTLPRVKWLVSSRNLPQIEQRLRVDPARTRLSLEIQQNAEQVARAVSAYIDARVSSLPCIQDDAGLQQHVRSVMQQRADGTFLWVSLVVDELSKANSWEIEQIIDEVPRGLTELDRRMVEQIGWLKRGTSELCRLVVLTMIASYRPLSLLELAALSRLPQHIASRTEHIEALVKTCGSLFTVRDGVVYMAHQSARDFLVDEALRSMFSIDIRQIHHDLYRCSIQILSNVLRRDIYGLQHPGSRLDQVRRPSPDPLATTAYACVYWIDHLRDCNPAKNATSDLQDSGPIARFLTSKYLNWLEAVSLLGSLSKGIAAISKLHTLLPDLFKTPVGSF